MRDTVINLLNIRLTRNRNQYFHLAFLVALTNFVKSCVYEKIVSTTVTSTIRNGNVESISAYRNLIDSNPIQEIVIEDFFYNNPPQEGIIENFSYNNPANNLWQDNFIPDISFSQILDSLKPNAGYIQSSSWLMYPMLSSAFKNLLAEPKNNQVVLTANSEVAVVVIANIFSISTNISYKEMLVRSQLQSWYSMWNNNGNLPEYLASLLNESPLKAAIIICTALQAGNYFCSISDFWEIYQQHILFGADESFNKFSILTDYLKTLFSIELTDFLKNDLNDVKLENFPDLQDALLNAKYDNGNLIIGENNNLRYLILKPELYYGFENLLDEPTNSQVVLNTSNNQSLLVISNMFSDRNNIAQEELNARNQLDQYLSELSNNFNNRANYLHNLLNENPLKAAIMICKALKAGNYFCYISDFWDIYQNQILYIENPQFDKFSIFTNFLKGLSTDEITQCQKFIENNFSLACAERKFDFAKALLDTQDNNGQFILNHDADENLYNNAVEMAGLMQ